MSPFSQWGPCHRPGDYRSFDPSTMTGDGGRKPKKNNGSPGRARTADLVINSTRHPLFYAEKVEEF